MILYVVYGIIVKGSSLIFVVVSEAVWLFLHNMELVLSFTRLGKSTSPENAFILYQDMIVHANTPHYVVAQMDIFPIREQRTPITIVPSSLKFLIYIKTYKK